MNHAIVIALLAAGSVPLSLAAARFHQRPPQSRHGHTEPASASPHPSLQAANVAQRSSIAMTDPDCDVPEQQWLSFMPTRIDLCGTTSGDPNFPTLGRSGSFDINGDGRLDFVSCSNQWEPFGQGGVPASLPDLITVSEATLSETSVIRARRVSVWRPGTAVAEAIQTQIPGTTWARVYVLGWRDVDDDGDLDLVTYMQLKSSGQGDNYFFENIGYQKPAPPIAADINGDGRVDGADLGLLLVAWGPNP